MILPVKNMRYMQYAAAIAATSFATGASMYIAWASPTLPRLVGENSPIGKPVTDAQASWIVTILLLAAIPSTPLVPIMIEKLGIKKTLLISAMMLFFPWILIIFASNFWHLLIARFIGGFAYPLIATGAGMYTGEIADNDIRGKLSALLGLMRLIGICTVLIIGPFVSYTVLGIICSIAPVISFVTFFSMPESPYQLVKRNKIEEARKVLKIFSGRKSDDDYIEEKLMEIKTTISNDMTSRGTFFDFLTKKEYRKVFFIMLGVKTVQMTSGISAVEAYMQTIVGSSRSLISPEISSIIFGCVQIPAALLAAAVVDKLGRKPMLIISTIGCAIAMASEGVFFYLQDYAKVNVDQINWIPTIGLVVCVTMAGFGIINLPYVLVGELFPSNIKGVAVTFMTVYGVLIASGVTKLFEPISSTWGLHTVFWIYATCCVLGAVFTFLFLPETKGKSFMEIQTKINNNKSINDLNDEQITKF